MNRPDLHSKYRQKFNKININQYLKFLFISEEDVFNVIFYIFLKAFHHNFTRIFNHSQYLITIRYLLNLFHNFGFGK